MTNKNVTVDTYVLHQQFKNFKSKLMHLSLESIDKLYIESLHVIGQSRQAPYQPEHPALHALGEEPPDKP